MLHPQAKQFLDSLAAQNGPGWEELTPAEGRAVFASLKDLFGKGPPLAEVEDTKLAGVPVRVYTPDASGPLPVVVYFHGGGWVLGNRKTHDALCRNLAQDTPAVIVSVDYRLAPEHKFPVPLEDCYAVTLEVWKNAGRFPSNGRLAVAGDSAGGNLAAAVTLLARQHHEPEIDFQLLVYPATDRRCDTESYEQFRDGFGLTGTAMQAFWERYLNTADDGKQPLASPLLAEDLSGLPPAHVITAQYDILRDEGEAYARRLAEAGVSASCRRYDGMLHGFFHLSGVFDDGRKSQRDAAQVLAQAVHAK